MDVNSSSEPRNRVTWIAAMAVSAAAMVAGGCTGRGVQAIPPDAERVAAGEGEIEYESGKAGDIYVFDETDNKLVYSGQIRRDERLEVDPDEDVITINGRTVVERPLSENHRYRVYLRD